MIQLTNTINKLFAYAVKEEYKGYDPYDTLNSPFAGILTLGLRYGRIFWTQLGRRSPINFRPLLGIKKGVNPKALALFLESATVLVKNSGNDKLKSEMDKLAELLLFYRSPGVSGSAWGYNFPWQNRWQCLPKYTPTIVNTAFAGNALLDYAELSGSQQAWDAALSASKFILNDLNRKTQGDTICFSYTPLDKNFVHNANMLGAAFLARLAVKHNQRDLLDPALASLTYSMQHQHTDGSWSYAETPQQQWIDSFHTGFNLEALRRFLKLGLVPEYKQAFELGRKFYAENFFLCDGTPKYYHDKVYLTDIHAPAEALYFFSGEGEAFKPLITKVLNWTLTNMYDSDSGLFYFRKAPSFTIKIPYMRWSEAWALRGLVSCFINNK